MPINRNRNTETRANPVGIRIKMHSLTASLNTKSYRVRLLCPCRDDWPLAVLCASCSVSVWMSLSCGYWYEWVYRADIEIEKVFFVNRVSFWEKERYMRQSWPERVDGQRRRMFGLPLRPSIKSSVSPSRTDFHAENERVLRLSVSSAAIPSLLMIFTNKFFENGNAESDRFGYIPNGWTNYLNYE